MWIRYRVVIFVGLLGHDVNTYHMYCLYCLCSRLTICVGGGGGGGGGRRSPVRTAGYVPDYGASDTGSIAGVSDVMSGGHE